MCDHWFHAVFISSLFLPGDCRVMKPVVADHHLCHKIYIKANIYFLIIYIYVYMCVCVCVYVCVYMCVCTLVLLLKAYSLFKYGKIFLKV